MLKSMRDSASSPFIKILLGLLVLSFVSFYGVSRMKGGCNPDAAAEVNGEIIGSEEYMINLKRSYDLYRQWYKNSGLLDQNSETSEETLMKTVKEMVLENMITTKLKIQEAKSLGLSVGDTELAGYIKSRPMFIDEQKKSFDTERYDMFLRYNGLTSDQYESAQREQLLISKLEEFVKSAAKISEDEAKQDYTIRNESINLLYVKVETSNFEKGIGEPSESELKDFYDKNKDSFKTPQERKIEYLYLLPDDYIKFTNDELKGYYEKNYIPKNTEDLKLKRIKASHILFQSKNLSTESESLKLANQVMEKLKNGEDFEYLALKYNEDNTKYTGGDLGYFGPGKMVKEFDKAAFDLKKGEISKPVKTQFGYHIIKVTDVIPAGEVTFDRLKNEVASKFLMESKYNPQMAKPVGDDMKKDLTEIREEIVKNPSKSLSEFKGKGKIHYSETDFFSSSGTIGGILDSPQIVKTAFGLLPTEVSDVIFGFFTKTGYLVKVKEIKEPELHSFDNAKEKIKSEFAKRKALELAKDTAQSILNETLKNPGKFDSIAKARKLSVTETGFFKRNAGNSIPVLGTSPEIMNKGFGLSPKQPVLKDVITIDKNYYIIKLKDKKEADIQKFKSEKESLIKIALEQRQNELVSEFMDSLKNNAKIKRYEHTGEMM